MSIHALSAGSGKAVLSMRSRVLILLGTLILTLGVTLPRVLHAEQISHYGRMVEADAPARYCIGCHDGTAASNIPFCSVRCAVNDSHSAEKRYPPAGKERLYAPLATVQAKGLKVVDGKITCISCHNLRNKDRYHLVMDNANSRLCLTCHIRM